jgi:hypothetical protein
MKFYLNIFLSILLFSCKESNKSTQADSLPKTANSSELIDAKRSNLPPLTVDMIKKMLAEVDYIDYIMHDLPFSLSQDTKADINSNIMFISNNPVGNVPVNCKPIGRKFYNIKGETYLAADIYFSNGCAFYIFLEGEKPLYSAKFTKEGYNFYTQIVAQGAKAGQGTSGKK